MAPASRRCGSRSCPHLSRLSSSRTNSRGASSSRTSKRRSFTRAFSTTIAGIRRPPRQGGGGGGGAGGGGGGEGGGGGGGRGGDDSPPPPPPPPPPRIPTQIRQLVDDGVLPSDTIEQYLALAKSPLVAFLLQSQPWRLRLLGDAAFLVKLGMEMFNGVVAQVIAEYDKRRSNFFPEFDYVLADILTSLFANFAAVWTTCPQLSLGGAGPASSSASAFQKFVSKCPANAFQTVGGGQAAFSMKERVAALFLPMPLLFAIGFGACAAGCGLTTVLAKARRSLNPAPEGQAEVEAQAQVGGPPLLQSSVAIGVFLAVSSNLRYQVISGLVEQRWLSVLLPSPVANSAASFAVRTANLYVGATTIVDWLRVLGLQS